MPNTNLQATFSLPGAPCHPLILESSLDWSLEHRSCTGKLTILHLLSRLRDIFGYLRIGEDILGYLFGANSQMFTNSLKGMLHNNLNINAKYEFAGNFFPSRGALPPPDFGKLLALEFGTSILHRQVNYLAFTFSTVSVHHDGAGGQSQTELESSINNSFPAFIGPSPIARTKHHLRIRILKIMMEEFPRNSEQQRRRVLCGTSTTFLSTNLSLTSAVFTLPTGLQ
jgi:hypothetical protein